MTKKKIFKVLLITIIVIGIIIGTFHLLKYLENKKYNDKLSNSIIKNEWSREGNGDTEFIYFGENGEFGYYCACGNGVDGYEMCDSYKYDEETKTIKLECLLPNIDNKIEVIESDDYHLVLNINDEERTFESENIHLLENPLDFAGTKFESSNQEINLIFKKDGTYEAYDSTKKEYTLSSGDCWTWTHKENSNEIILKCNDETTRKIEIKEYSETELKLHFKTEKQTIIFHQK